MARGVPPREPPFLRCLCPAHRAALAEHGLRATARPVTVAPWAGSQHLPGTPSVGLGPCVTPGPRGRLPGGLGLQGTGHISEQQQVFVCVPVLSHCTQPLGEVLPLSPSHRDSGTPATGLGSQAEPATRPLSAGPEPRAPLWGAQPPPSSCSRSIPSDTRGARLAFWSLHTGL